MTEGKKKTVLAVDDETALLRVVARSLDKYFNIETAKNADEAIEKINEFRDKIGLVLTDWDMVNCGDGAHVVKAAKGAGIEHVIAWSGREHSKEMSDAGASLALTKPEESIVQIIREMLGDIENQPPTDS